MNPYEALIQSSPVEGKEAQLMAARLRNQDDRATLALLSGDKPLGRVAELEAGNTARTVKGLQKAKEQALMRSEQQADRAGQNSRHQQSMDARSAEALAQREATAAYRSQMAQQHNDMMAYRRDGQQITQEETQSRLDLMQSKEDTKISKEMNNNARKLSTKLVDEGITDLEAAFETSDALISKYADPNTGVKKEDAGDIPGVGPLDNARPHWTLSEDGKALRTHLAGVRNRILKARSGAAVTDPEMRRLAEELGSSLGGTEQEMLTAYANLKRATSRVKSGIYGGYAPEVQDLYDNQFATHRGIVPSSDQKLQQRQEGLRTRGGTAYEVIKD